MTLKVSYGVEKSIGKTNALLSLTEGIVHSKFRSCMCFLTSSHITSSIRQCDVVFLMFLLHMTFKETDAQEMQKRYGFTKINSSLNSCGCNTFNF